MSAKNITFLTMAGEAVHRTMKTARHAVERGTHRWLDDSTVLELQPGTSNSDPRRFLRFSLNRPGQYEPPTVLTHIPAGLAPLELPDCYFVSPLSMPRPTIAAISERWNWKYEPGTLPEAITLRPADWQ